MTASPALRSSAADSRIAVIAILLVGILLRFHQIDRYSLWIDEISSLQMSDGYDAGEPPEARDTIQQRGIDATNVDDARPLSAIQSALAHDTHPPLYFLLLRLWRDLFGPSDSATRSLSAIASAACILALYDAAATLYGRATAVWAAAIACAATPQIVYAQETRGYSLLTFFILCGIASLARIEKLGPSRMRSIALATSLLAALLIHYLAFPALMAMALYSLIQLEKRERHAALIAMITAVALFSLLWGPTLWSQRHNFGPNLSWTADDQPGLLSRTIGRLASLPIQFFISPVYLVQWPARLGAVLYLCPLLLWRRRDLLIWILLAAAIIGTATLSDLLNHRRQLDYLRFTLAASPAAYMIVAAAAARLRKAWLARGILAATLLWCIAWLPSAYDQFWRADYRMFVRSLDDVAGPNDLVIVPFASHADWNNAMLLAAITHYSQYPHRPTLVLSHPISPDLLHEASTYPGAWWLSDQVNTSNDLPGVGVVEVYNVHNVGARVRLNITPHPATYPASQP